MQINSIKKIALALGIALALPQATHALSPQTAREYTNSALAAAIGFLVCQLSENTRKSYNPKSWSHRRTKSGMDIAYSTVRTMALGSIAGLALYMLAKRR